MSNNEVEDELYYIDLDKYVKKDFAKTLPIDRNAHLGLCDSIDMVALLNDNYYNGIGLELSIDNNDNLLISNGELYVEVYYTDEIRGLLYLLPSLVLSYKRSWNNNPNTLDVSTYEIINTAGALVKAFDIHVNNLKIMKLLMNKGLI